MIAYHELSGDTLDAEQVTIPKVRDLVATLHIDTRPFVRLIECRAKDNLEVVIFDVEVECGQQPVYPIHRDERIAAIFDKADKTTPQAWALRKDFPQVPHLNIGPFDSPKSLCLYDEPFRGRKPRWTAVRFVERIREWLALTAKGILHQDDQPLEPLLIGHKGTMVLPASLQEAEETSLPTHLSIVATCTDSDRYFLLGDLNPRRSSGQASLPSPVFITPSPHQHGVIRWCP